MPKRKATPQPGPIWHEGLPTITGQLEAFAYELKQVSNDSRHISLAMDIEDFLANLDSDTMPPEKEEEAGLMITEAIECLEEIAPPYCYFGTFTARDHDYGFWVDWSSLESFDGLRVSDLAEIPRGYSGEVLLISDHGNATLYAVSRGRLKEIWSVV